jgi:hypothetical protein
MIPLAVPIAFAVLALVAWRYDERKMGPLARETRDRFIARFMGLHFLGGPALHVLARFGER